MCGTPNYIAPEILQSSGHSFEADIWSLACLMLDCLSLSHSVSIAIQSAAIDVFRFALITGKPPFQTRPIREIYSRVIQAKYRPHAVTNKNARDLIRSTLVVVRASFTGSHPLPKLTSLSFRIRISGRS